ncbi:kinase-like protein, partial [Zopfia rhizophila CBS 207.26]
DILAEEYGWEPGHRVFGPSGNIPLTVCNILGNGSLGIVEEVKAKGCQHRSFVRKTVQLPFHKRRERLNIIQEEAHILQKLTHSHIVSILGSYEDSIQVNRRFYCLLMLPVGENDLKTFLEIAGDAKTVNTQWQGWIWRWFGCLASALAYMHSEGVRHQDIKPSNIIHNGGDIYFTDFSSSSRFEIGQTTSTENPSRSSAMYGAPEVVDTFYDNGSLQRHGRGSDIFALGCVFCEMLTVAEGGSVSSFHEHLLSESIPGNRLGPGASAARGMLLYSRKTGQIRDWFKSSIFFVECISAMLSFDRGSRPSAANIVEKVLKTQSCQSECVC